MLSISNLRLPLDAGTPDGAHLITEAVARVLGVASAQIECLTVRKRSVDARQRTVCLVYSIDVRLALQDGGDGDAVERGLLERLGIPGGGKVADNVSIRQAGETGLPPIVRRGEPLPARPVVVGSGPAGLFCALVLAEAGERPVVLERGGTADERIAAIGEFNASGLLDTDCNVQFGEGGAGTFSDGKLSTNTKSPWNRYVLRRFVEAGASEEILWQAHPHIGSDVLPRVVRNLRERIVELGGEVRFHAYVCDIVVDDRHLVRAAGGDAAPCVTGVRYVDYADPGLPLCSLNTDTVVLACGHSARDVFEMLRDLGVALERKPFSMGVRIEHSQRAVDRAQYGRAVGHPALGAASYKLACHLGGARRSAGAGRGVYTFCMCPGGEVLAAASEEGCVVTNGASVSARDGANANAGLLVDVYPSDIPGDDPLAGIRFQRQWERRAFELGGGAFRAPAQLLGDFMQGVASSGAGSIQQTYARGVTWGDMSQCLPPFVVQGLREGVPVLARRLRGFDVPDAVLTGVETRSSSPVRVLRDRESLQASIEGLYPCGEGAGYAGGIMSAATDGIRVARTILVSGGRFC